MSGGKVILGNWKMNHALAEVKTFAHELMALESSEKVLSPLCGIAPQFPYLISLRESLSNSPLMVGGQNCAPWEKGAYTGEVSARALADVGAGFVLVGHSERRLYFREGNDLLTKKMQMAFEARLKVVFCVGETLEERQKGDAFEVVRQQIEFALGKFAEKSFEDSLQRKLHEELILAYEPVWAIGTGQVATTEQAQEMHFYIRSLLKNLFSAQGNKIKILYGGSVNPKNIESLLSEQDIDGALVGGASLVAKDFFELCRVAKKWT